MVSAAFGQRRKTLATPWPAAQLGADQAAGIDPDVAAETLAAEQFGQLRRQ